ncbi:putative UPF0481 protein At3g02645 [Rhododendron vialii]|uniref:putative UPF0481 protein At3g02645 n=1 Tax=Rhododendron vialii TaxID=182163 RepID=UPI00265DA98A|nr:putative UPF0481 protein At3g02645 [Rhododendron vialii]
MHRRMHGTAIMRSPLVGESEIKTSCGEKNIDPIWHCNLTATTVKHDLVLLENQIPFFVLEKLFRLTVDRIQNSRPLKFSLDHYVVHYFGSMMSQEEDSTSSGGTTAPTSRGSPGDSTVLRISLDDQMKSSEEDGVQTSHAQRYYYHILHKLHEYYLPQKELNKPHEDYLPQHQTKEKKPGEEGRFEMIMPCASELDYAAVKFEPVRKDLFKVDFIDPKGPFWWCHMARFKIPMLEIYDETELFLRNLIAFEQCCPGVSLQYFTSYAYLMDMLINSENDVQVLEQAEVIFNYLGARADATKLFNNLCKEVGLGEFFFAAMCNKATAYSKGRWPKNLAYIRRTFFASPWTFIAFVVAFIAFGIQIVTFVQSFL